MEPSEEKPGEDGFQSEEDPADLPVLEKELPDLEKLPTTDEPQTEARKSVPPIKISPTVPKEQEEHKSIPIVQGPRTTQKLTEKMFDKITAYVLALITDSTEDYELLEKLNKAAVTKYDTMTDNTKNLLEFLDKAHAKNNTMQPHLEQIDQLCKNIAKLEDVVSNLDQYTKRLEAQFKSLY